MRHRRALRLSSFPRKLIRLSTFKSSARECRELRKAWIDKSASGVRLIILGEGRSSASWAIYTTKFGARNK